MGLSAGLTPGPLLTLVISQTLKHNIGEGIKVALAPLITDLPIILLSLVVLARLAAIGQILGLVSLFGGLYVLFLAWECIRTGPVALDLSEARPRSLQKAALVNVLNPNPYLFWVTVGAPLIIKFDKIHSLAPWGFVLGFYILLVGSKVILALIVGRYRRALKSRGYLYLMRGLGGVLVVFSLVLFKDALAFWGY